MTFRRGESIFDTILAVDMYINPVFLSGGIKNLFKGRNNYRNPCDGLWIFGLQKNRK